MNRMFIKISDFLYYNCGKNWGRKRKFKIFNKIDLFVYYKTKELSEYFYILSKPCCWWVKDGNNWHKTKWIYVLTCKHKFKELKYMNA